MAKKKKWTLADLKRKGVIHNYDDKPKPKAIKIEKVSIEKETISRVLWVFHHEKKIPEYVSELQFLTNRRFRFDWAIPDWKLAIEYEGVFSTKSRHTNVKGYSKDCEKYNLAQINGWTVLRYTAMNYNQFHLDLKTYIDFRFNQKGIY